MENKDKGYQRELNKLKQDKKKLQESNEIKLNKIKEINEHEMKDLKNKLDETKKSLMAETTKYQALHKDKDEQYQQYQVEKKQYEQDKSELSTKIKTVEAERYGKDDTIKSLKEKAQALEKSNVASDNKLKQKNDENAKLMAEIKKRNLIQSIRNLKIKCKRKSRNVQNK